jgi:hypothetical protein
VGTEPWDGEERVEKIELLHGVNQGDQLLHGWSPFYGERIMPDGVSC